MNKLLLAAGLFFVINGCNNSSEKHTNHSSIDSTSHAHPDTTTETSGIKVLMDSMMMRMHQHKSTGNNDVDYANMMLQHHQGAVDMAVLQESKGSNLVLKEFSRKVITDQQKEIAMMAEFISKAPASTSPNNEIFKLAMDSSMQTMMKAETKIYNEIDKDFVAQMIPHHQSAVDMATVYLQYGTNDILRKMSQSIVQSQAKEIEWLKAWITKNG